MGLGLHLIVFMYPFHASPDDFMRFTHRGIETLFQGWSIRDRLPASGPISAMLLILQEFLSIFLSFGSTRLQSLIHLGLCFVLFPFKYLDLLFLRSNAFLSLTPLIMTTVQKVAHVSEVADRESRVSLRGQAVQQKASTV